MPTGAPRPAGRPGGRGRLVPGPSTGAASTPRASRCSTTSAPPRANATTSTPCDWPCWAQAWSSSAGTRPCTPAAIPTRPSGPARPPTWPADGQGQGRPGGVVPAMTREGRGGEAVPRTPRPSGCPPRPTTRPRPGSQGQRRPAGLRLPGPAAGQALAGAGEPVLDVAAGSGALGAAAAGRGRPRPVGRPVAPQPPPLAPASRATPSGCRSGTTARGRRLRLRHQPLPDLAAAVAEMARVAPWSGCSPGPGPSHLLPSQAGGHGGGGPPRFWQRPYRCRRPRRRPARRTGRLARRRPGAPGRRDSTLTWPRSPSTSPGWARPPSSTTAWPPSASPAWSRTRPPSAARPSPPSPPSPETSLDAQARARDRQPPGRVAEADPTARWRRPAGRAPGTRAELRRQAGRDAVDGRSGLGRRGDLGEQVVGAGGGDQAGGLGAAAEAGQGQGLVLGRPEVRASSSRASAAGGSRRLATSAAQLDLPAVAERAVELAGGPLQQAGGPGVVAGDQGALGQGELGVEAGMGAGGCRAEQVGGAVGQVPGPAQLAQLAPEPEPAVAARAW